jgi:uncharacterized membrane protein YjjB (DUF3815 family)
MSGDMLAGVSRLAEAILLSVGIAGGVGIVLQLYTILGDGPLVSMTSSYPIWIPTLCAMIATPGFCILFHSPKATIIYTSIVGACGQFTVQYLMSIGQSSSIACFVGACVIALLAEFCSRAGKDATTIFIIPGIIPLVPGGLLYRSMTELLGGDVTSAASLAITTLITSLSIAAALVVISSLTRLFVRIVRKIKTLLLVNKH